MMDEKLRSKVEFVLTLFEDPKPDVQLVASTLVSTNGHVQGTKTILAAANPIEHRLKGRAGTALTSKTQHQSVPC